MFSLAFLAIVVASASAHSISHVHRRHAQVARDTAPEGWATGYLEPYDTYHTRYLAIDCEGKHNTTAFDLCCHPLLATETLANNRNACCAPGATVLCPGETSSLSATASKTASAAAASASSAEDEDCDDEDDTDDDDEDCDAEDDGDDEEEEDCSDDGDDESSTTASTKAAVTTASTKVAVTTASTKAAVTTASSTVVAPKATTTTEAKPTTTTTKAQPTTTTTTEAKPPTTTTEAKTTTAKPTTTTPKTTQKATTATTASSSLITGGFGTWFTQNGVAGACGTVHSDSAKIVALQTEKYNNGANCGRTVKITDLNNGKSTTATVADECPTCTNPQCLDMSEGLFQFFEDLSVGEMDIEWEFTD